MLWAMSTSPEHPGPALRRLRREHEIPQEVIAALARLDVPKLSRFERGLRPPDSAIETAIRLAIAQALAEREATP